MAKSIAIKRGDLLSPPKDNTFTVVVTFSADLESVFSSVTVIERDEAGDYWLEQEKGTISEIANGSYLYLEISEVPKGA